MTTAELGTLERDDVRKAWQDEAKDFTPWLADNLERLSFELGLELELEGKEVSVGSLRADIVARVSHSDDRVLIENQLASADLKHLGQILAYLAGLEAKIIVWVATDFGDEHLSAVRWLNEHTVDPFAFFAVKLSVVRIGDSPLAPTLEVLERPNEWDRQVQESTRSGELTERGTFYREFWEHVAGRWPVPPIRPGWAANNVANWVEEADLKVYRYVAGGSVGLYLRPGQRDKVEDFEARVEPYRDLFESEINGLTYRDGGWWCWTSLADVNTRDRARWDEYADWLEKTRLKYEEILRSDPGAEE